MNTIFRHSIIAACLIPLIGCNDSQALVPTKEPRPIQVIKVKTANEQAAKRFTGTLQSAESAAVAFRVPGTIQKILVKTGDYVEKGQPLASLDPHDYQVALEELQARALEAKSAHKLAKAELARVKQAIADDAIANVNLDRAISGYERSEAAVKVVEQNIRRAKDTLRYTQLRAPFSGVVATSNFDQYEQVLPGISVFTLHKPDLLEVEVDVPENLIHQFKPKQPAAISWYGEARSVAGQVTEISTLPDPIKQTYTVTYQLDGLNQELLPGKAVTLTTNLGSTQPTLCVPYSAIVKPLQQDLVFTIKDQTAHAVPVSVVSFNHQNACVQSQLNAGDYVVVSGAQYIQEGQHFPSIQVKEL